MPLLSCLSLPVLVRLTIAVMKHYEQSNLGGKGVWKEPQQGRTSEAGADAEHGGVLLTVLLPMACSASFLIALGRPYP